MKVLAMTAWILLSIGAAASADPLDDAMDAPMGSDGEQVFEIDWLGKSLRDGRTFQQDPGTGRKNCAIRTPVIQVQVLGLNASGANDVTVYALGPGFAISGWDTGRLELAQVKDGEKTRVRASIDLSTCDVCTRGPEPGKPSCR